MLVVIIGNYAIINYEASQATPTGSLQLQFKSHFLFIKIATQSFSSSKDFSKNVN